MNPVASHYNHGMRITDFMRKLEASLTQWGGQNDGAVILAETPRHAMEFLNGGTDRGLNILLWWEGDTHAQEQIAESTMTRGKVWLALHREAGLEYRRGATLTRDTPARKALLNLVDELREYVEALEFPDSLGVYPDGGMVYKGMTYLATQKGELLHGYALTFEIDYTRRVMRKRAHAAPGIDPEAQAAANKLGAEIVGPG